MAGRKVALRPSDRIGSGLAANLILRPRYLCTSIQSWCTRGRRQCSRSPKIGPNHCERATPWIPWSGKDATYNNHLTSPRTNHSRAVTQLSKCPARVHAWSWGPNTRSNASMTCCSGNGATTPARPANAHAYQQVGGVVPQTGPARCQAPACGPGRRAGLALAASRSDGLSCPLFRGHDGLLVAAYVELDDI